MTYEEREKVKRIIYGILLADHLGDVARELPKLFELAGVDINEFQSFEDAWEKWKAIEPEYFL